MVYDVLDNLDSYEPDEDTLDNPDLAVRLVETKIEVILTFGYNSVIEKLVINALKNIFL